MGWLRRRSDERDVEAFWRDGAPFDLRGETKIGFGHFEVMAQTDSAPVVLFVTDRRMIVRYLGPRGQFASGMLMKPFTEVDKIVKGLPERPGEFAFLITLNGKTTPVVLRPASREPGVVAVCERLYKDTVAAFDATKT